MQVKSIEMTLTKLDKASIEDFKFKARIACRDLKNLNPAIWISKPILNILLKQANKDVTEASKSSSGQLRYFKYSQMTTEELVSGRSTLDRTMTARRSSTSCRQVPSLELNHTTVVYRCTEE